MQTHLFFWKRHYQHKPIVRDACDIDILTFTFLCFVLSNTDEVLSIHTNPNCMNGQHDEDNNVFVDSDDDYMCGDVKEYQQVQSAGNLNDNSDDSVCETSEEGSVSNDAGEGNLDGLSEGEWNALFDEEHSLSTLHDTTQKLDEHKEVIDANMLDVDVHDDIDSVASSFDVRRHPRDPTYATGEDGFEETGYMPESEMTKSCIGIKHPRSESVLLHCDAEKLLQVTRGFRSHTCGDEGCVTNLKRVC